MARLPCKYLDKIGPVGGKPGPAGPQHQSGARARAPQLDGGARAPFGALAAFIRFKSRLDPRLREMQPSCKSAIWRARPTNIRIM